MCDSESDEMLQGTPPEVGELARSVTQNLLPEKSREQYKLVYKKFKDW